MTTVVESSQRAKRIAWIAFGLTVAVWLVAGGMRLTRPVIESVMNGGEEIVDVAFNAVLLAFAATGAFVASRRPTNAIGWLLGGMGVLKVIGFVAREYAIHALVWKPGDLPGGDIAVWVWNFTYVPLFLALPYVLLLFPDGRLPSARWRWLAVLLAANGLVLTVGAGIANWQQRGAGLLMDQFEMPAFLGASLVVAGFGLIASAVSLIFRYALASGEQRSQLKWLALSGTLMAFWIVAEMIRQAAGLEDAAATLVVDGLGVVALLSFPAAVAVAVLKYRLYDIDRIMSRTLAYAILVGLLGGAYLLAVLALQAALPISDDSPAIVAASTLVVAAAFGPLRARVKGAVDRRFNRAGYDAQRTVDGFSRRLRTYTDLDHLQDDLLTVVGRAVDPTHVSVWFSHSEGRR